MPSKGVNEMPADARKQHEWRRPAGGWQAASLLDLAWRPPTKQFSSKLSSSTMRCYTMGSSERTGLEAATGTATIDRPKQLHITERSPAWAWTDYQMDAHSDDKKLKPGWVSKEVSQL
jgi:hypothetical protein